MEKNKILNADILDIIFEGKNKLYGAYELRKTYNRRMKKAIFSTVVLVLFAFLGTLYSGMRQRDTGDTIDVTESEFAKLKKIELPVLPPPVPIKVQPPPISKQIQFKSMKIVPDELVDKNDELKEIKDDMQIGNKTIESDIKSEVGQPPVYERETGVFEKPKGSNEDSVFLTVQNEAQFPGGQSAWIRYLQKNLNANAPIDNGAPPGTYRVIVKFIVGKDGIISDVNAITKFGFGMEEEAVKIIKRGPKWVPALENGRNVNAYRGQPVTFIVEEP